MAEITLLHLKEDEGYIRASVGRRNWGEQRTDQLSENTEDDLNISLRILSTL
jgi:hypothetical protein